MKRKFYVFAALFWLIFNAHANPQVEKAPVPQWITPVSIPVPSSVKKEDVTSGFCSILIDKQIHLASQTNYFHYGRKIFSKSGVQNGSEIQVMIDPQYEKLKFHYVKIIRGKKEIDKLDLGRITVLDEEKDRSKYLYSGTKTFLLILDDVREGDIIEYAFSIEGYNPIYNGIYHQSFYFQSYDPIDHIFYKIIAPAEKKLNVKQFNNAKVPTVVVTGKEQIFVMEQKNIPGMKTEDYSPSWYDPYDVVSIGEWESWQAVKAWAGNVFDLSYDFAPVKKEALGISLSANTPEDKALAALKFVQNEVRYTGFEGGIGAFKPHTPDVVLSNRFGDCKDKAVLLCQLLKFMNIEAYPVLVNSYFLNAVDTFLPSANAFNHVIVQIRINNNIYWVDPTASHQQGKLEHITLSDFKKGLVLNHNAEEGLVDIHPFQLNKVSISENYDIPAFNEGITYFKVTSKYYGAEANSQRYLFDNSNLKEVQENYLNFYAKIYREIEPEGEMVIKDDTLQNIFVIEESYAIKNFWDNEKDNNVFTCTFYPYDLSDKIRKPSRRIRKMPLALPYPYEITVNIKVNLPETWQIKNNNILIENDLFKYTKDIKYKDKVLNLDYAFVYKKESANPDELETYFNDLDKLDSQITYQLTHSLPDGSFSFIDFFKLLIVLLAIGFSIHFILKINRYDPDPIYTFKPLPIGGWLVLLAVGLFASPLLTVADLIRSNYFETWMWSTFLDFSLETFNIGLALLFLVEVVLNIFLVLFSLLLIYQFFKKRTSFPRLLSIFYLSKLSFIILDSVLVSLITGNEPESSDISEIFKGILGAVIWVSYINISDRSKETFLLNRMPRDKEAAPMQEQNTQPEEVHLNQS